MPQVLKVGPWGVFVQPNQDYSLEDGRKLTEITVYSKDYVNGVEVNDADADGNNPNSHMLGEKIGDPTTYPITDGEKITVISGSMDTCNKIIKSLHFDISNKNAYPNDTFSLPVPWCHVSGFFANYNGNHLVSWGVKLSPGN